MLKNAFLSIKKNIGKTVLLFVIMTVIANLIIAGLSIQSASKKSMEQIRTSLGNDVTLTTNMQNMMGQREKGQAVSEVAASVTIAMADQLKDLKYVKNYNYAISTTASSDDITPQVKIIKQWNVLMDKKISNQQIKEIFQSVQIRRWNI